MGNFKEGEIVKIKSPDWIKENKKDKSFIDNFVVREFFEPRIGKILKITFCKVCSDYHYETEIIKKGKSKTCILSEWIFEKKEEQLEFDF